MLVTVADNGEGFNAKTSGTGIGLKNVRERLRLRYAGDANLSVVANFPAAWRRRSLCPPDRAARAARMSDARTCLVAEDEALLRHRWSPS